MQESTAILPFDGDPRGLKLVASASWRDQALELTYRLSGALPSVVIPGLAPAPSRRDQLWEHTCFEAFIADPRNEGYWELNVSPARNWNLYRFDGYRAGMAREERVDALEVTVARAADGLNLTARLELARLLPPIAELALGLTAVIERCDGDLSYWALAHCAQRPDFHLRESFRLRLPAAEAARR